MAIKRKRRVKKKQRFNLFNNLVILSLLVLTFGFLGSMFQRLLFNTGTSLTKLDLSKMISSTKYEDDWGHKIEVEVRNGCGVPKLADMYTGFLRAKGYDVLGSKNAEHFSYDQTVILRHNEEIERALSLANTMGIDESLISIIDDNSQLHDATLIIGRDYRRLNSYKKALRYITPY